MQVVDEQFRKNLFWAANTSLISGKSISKAPKFYNIFLQILKKVKMEKHYKNIRYWIINSWKCWIIPFNHRFNEIEGLQAVQYKMLADRRKRKVGIIDYYEANECEK